MPFSLAFLLRACLSVAVFAASSAYAGTYLEGAFAYRKLALSNSVTSFGSLDMNYTYEYSGEIGVQVNRWTVALRGDYATHEVTTVSAANRLTQIVGWALVGLPFGGRLKIEPLAGVGYLVKSELALTGTNADGTHTNQGLAFLGALRLAFGIDPKARLAVIAEGGYRFVMPIEFTSTSVSLGGDTSGLYGRGGVRLSF